MCQLFSGYFVQRDGFEPMIGVTKIVSHHPPDFGSVSWVQKQN